MTQNSPKNFVLLLLVFFFSAGLILLALYAQTNVQGPLNVPGDFSFTAWFPGTYSLYRENLIDPNSKITPFSNDTGLNEILLSRIEGSRHLAGLYVKTWNTGDGIPYYIKEPKSGLIRMGIPFAKFEILWPGSYDLHVEFSPIQVVNKNPNVTVGPIGLIPIAIGISIIAQLVVLIVIINSSRFFQTAPEEMVEAK